MLIDATIYLELLRRGEDLRFILKPYLIANQLFTCGVVRAEVLRGIRSVELRDEVSELFDLMIEVPTGSQAWKAVALMAWTLDRRGIVLPLTDIAIGCCALDAGTTVVTSDPHFSRIPGLKTKRTLN
jgi:predicted nucleic acid-binding protein